MFKKNKIKDWHYVSKKSSVQGFVLFFFIFFIFFGWESVFVFPQDHSALNNHPTY